MTVPSGTYLVIDAIVEPQVHMLTEAQHRTLRELESLKTSRRAVLHRVFGVAHGLYAIPAWSIEAMQSIATAYTGPHQTTVRGIAAALALGVPFGPSDDDNGRNMDGGTKVPRVPLTPTPSGPTFAELLNSGTTSGE